MRLVRYRHHTHRRMVVFGRALRRSRAKGLRCGLSARAPEAGRDHPDADLHERRQCGLLARRHLTLPRGSMRVARPRRLLLLSFPLLASACGGWEAGDEVPNENLPDGEGGAPATCPAEFDPDTAVE